MSGNESEGRGRVVAVIGGGNGIGAATGRLLHERGWRVAFADIDEAAAGAMARECDGFGVRVDVLDAASIAHAAERIESGAGPVYGLVNAAAIFAPQTRPEELPLDTWQKIADSSYRGTYVCIVEFAKRMSLRGAGAIVNISSMVGERPNHGHAYYSAKAAVNALTVGMAGEWGRSGIRVNAVSPGYVAVPRMVENIRAGNRYPVSPVDMSALGRLVAPAEVAEVISFLLSDRASAVSGANVPVDAGVMAAHGWHVHGGVPPARAAG